MKRFDKDFTLSFFPVGIGDHRGICPVDDRICAFV